MNLRFKLDIRVAGFAGAALLMALAYVAIMKGLVALPGGPLPGWVMAVDLLLVLPVAWLLLAPRDWRRRWPMALGIGGLGFLVGRWLAPEDDALWSALGDLRWLALALVVAAELWLLSGVVRHVWRTPPDINAEAAAGHAVRRAFGNGAVGRLMLVEARLWIYALMRRPAAAPFAGNQHFSVHRQHGNASNQQGFVILMAAEIPILHVLLHLGFGATVAWVVTAISAYGWLFLWAEYRATIWRPVSIGPDVLHLRYGLLFDVALPRGYVLSAETIGRKTALPRVPTCLRLQGMGLANLRLRLRPGTRVQLPWGEREVDEIALGLDEPERFVQALVDPAKRD